MGKGPGRNLSGDVIAEDVEFAVVVGEAEAVVLGFAFTGRSG